jgi:hypothetical protein
VHCDVWVLELSQYTPGRRLRGEEVYSSYSFSTSELDGGEWSASRPGRAVPPGKGPPVLIGQETGWAPEPVWTLMLEEKSFRLCRGSNLDRPVVQPVRMGTALQQLEKTSEHIICMVETKLSKQDNWLYLFILLHLLLLLLLIIIIL